MPNIAEQYAECQKKIKDIEQSFGIYRKNDQLIFIRKYSSQNHNYWANDFEKWEPETFEIFDRFLNKDKVFIDIGGWIGSTCIYASHKSKHVYVVEADPYSVQELIRNCSDNATNITVIDKAIANRKGATAFIGANKFYYDRTMNASTSQVYEEHVPGTIAVSTITIDDILMTNQVSLIKVDIEGGEEDILEDLFRVNSSLRIPIYISFHIDWWKDKNIDRFSFMTIEQRNSLRQNPFHSLLFV